jgi:hypothetical protein
VLVSGLWAEARLNQKDPTFKNFPRMEDRDPCRVISGVLQPSQSFQQEFFGVSMPDIADNPAYDFPSNLGLAIAPF